MTYNDLVDSGWRLHKTTTTYWAKWFEEKEKMLHLSLISIEVVSEKTGEVKTFWEIQSRKNPLPVKGIFESSYEALRKFLVGQGFFIDGSLSKKEVYIIYN